MIFVCAHGDLFHEDVPDEWIDRVFAVMALAPQHTFQVLTKRAERMAKYMNGIQSKIPFLGRMPLERIHLEAAGHMEGDGGFMDTLKEHGNVYSLYLDAPWPLPNVWLGVSAEDQSRAEDRIPQLLHTPAAIRFVSAEPLLGAIDFEALCTGWNFIDALRGQEYHDAPEPYVSASKACARLDWIIVGGESGPGARPMHPDWARWIRDHCAAAGVPFFFKQWGEFAPAFDKNLRPLRFHPWNGDDQRAVARGTATAQQATKRIGKRQAGRWLDGVEHNGMPRITP
jgi:protein gp37